MISGRVVRDHGVGEPAHVVAELIQAACRRHDGEPGDARVFVSRKSLLDGQCRFTPVLDVTLERREAHVEWPATELGAPLLDRGDPLSQLFERRERRGLADRRLGFVLGDRKPTIAELDGSPHRPVAVPTDPDRHRLLYRRRVHRVPVRLEDSIAIDRRSGPRRASRRSRRRRAVPDHRTARRALETLPPGTRPQRPRSPGRPRDDRVWRRPVPSRMGFDMAARGCS